MIDNVIPPLEPPPFEQFPPATQSPPVKKFWGAWATIGFGAIVIVAILIVQGVVAVIFAVLQLLADRQMEIKEFTRQLVSYGNLFSVATFATFVVGMILVLIFIRVRQGATLKEYLAINPISNKAIAAVIAIVIGFLAISFFVNNYRSNPPESDMMLEAYRSVTWAPMLWIAAVICAPVFEESLFRGFLFTGLQNSKVGTVGTIFLTALPWALLHIQYDLIQIGMIFFLGILLGIARTTTRSIWSPLIIHSLNNLLAMVELYLRAGGILN
jgi:membrane protease YdiL (CAAX protease family)